MTSSKFLGILRGTVLATAAMSLAMTTIVRAGPPASGTELSKDAIKAQSSSLCGLLVAQIRALPANGTSPENFEAAIVQVIAQTSSNQEVQITALTCALAVKGLPVSAESALRRVLVAARAGRLAGTAALDGGGFLPSSSFSAPVVSMGGGSVNYNKP